MSDNTNSNNEIDNAENMLSIKESPMATFTELIESAEQKQHNVSDLSHHKSVKIINGDVYKPQ